MIKILPFFKSLVISLLLMVGVVLQLNAQTKGMIIKPATGTGRLVLDPNGDGYVSSPGTPLGFKFNDVQESEIPYRAIPLPAGEILGDLLRGPSGGFTDFSYLYGNVDPVYTYLSNGNLMFRFRLGGIAPNSKGYSILIDTDNRFGNTGPNADPNFTAANPGFEVEIVLATGFGVRLYNVDGVSSPATGSQLVNLPYDQYAQKAVAYTTNGGNPDYFYDFYIPFSEITKHIPNFTESTPVRMVANTIMSAQHSALAGPISDVGGVDDRQYAGNYTAAFTQIIQNVVPTAVNITPASDFPPMRSAVPLITGNYSAGSSTAAAPLRVNGTASEPAGTLITVYNNGTQLGITTVGTGGTWTYTLPAGTSLQPGDKLTATATASGKSVSNLSNPATVFAPAFNCTQSATPTIICASDKGFSGTVPAGVAAGSIIRIYKYGEPESPAAGIPDIPVLSNGTWSWNCTSGINDPKNQTNCNPGPGCVGTSVGNGSYYAVLTEEGKCASPRSNDFCVNTSSTATAPTLAQTTVSTSTTSLNGTAVAGATVSVLINNVLAGRSTVTSGSWTVSNLTFRVGDVVNVQAITSSTCPSARTAVQRVVVGDNSAIPIVRGPIRAGATSISGTSTEPAGTIITVFRNGQAMCTTNCPTVDAYGNWSLTGIATSLLTNGNTITATATAPGKAASGLSNTVTVEAAAPATPTVPTITGTYVEGATSVSGSGPANTTINLYIDGYHLGSVTSTATGAWTVTGLSGSNIEKLLYAGGVLNATSGTIGTNESASSNRVAVSCSTTIPDRTKQVTAAATAICQNSSALIQIINSEPGISYVLRDNANTADLSSSVLGTGGNITLSSYPLTSSQTIRVTAMRGESPGCGAAMLNNAVNITVNPNPQAFTITLQRAQVCAGSKGMIIVASSQTNVTYQIRRKSDNAAIGVAVVGTGGQITLETPELTAAGSVNYYVQAVSGIAPTFCGTQMSNEVTITVTALPSKTLELIEGSLNSDGTMNVLLVNSEPNVLYQLLINGSAFGTPVTGTGSNITLVSDVVTAESKAYTVSARRMDTGCSTELDAILYLQRATSLPVELVSFKATAQNNQVVLTWSTASELNNDRFEVERSQDGKSFTKIGTVQGKGTSSLTHHYTFRDSNPGNGANYYRLRQVDYDGTFEHSKTVTVSVKERIASIKVYPNPFQDYVRVEMETEGDGPVEVTLLDTQGRTVMQQKITSEGRYTAFELKTQHLATGVYFLKITGANSDTTTKLIKQN